MPPDLFDDRVIKVARVAHEVLADLVRVLQATEDIVDQGNLATLTKLDAFILLGGMNLLDPVLVGGGR